MSCGGREYVFRAVPVKLYRKYTEIMERAEGGSARETFRANGEILKEVFHISSRELSGVGVEGQLAAAKSVHFVMQEVVTPKFLELNPECPGQQEASAFDEYDEEEGYNEETAAESIWKVCRENLDRVVKLCIRTFHDSYTACMEADIISLLDYVKFEIMTANEK